MTQTQKQITQIYRWKSIAQIEQNELYIIYIKTKIKEIEKKRRKKRQ